MTHKELIQDFKHRHFNIFREPILRAQEAAALEKKERLAQRILSGDFNVKSIWNLRFWLATLARSLSLRCSYK